MREMILLSSVVVTVVTAVGAVNILLLGLMPLAVSGFCPLLQRQLSSEEC